MIYSGDKIRQISLILPNMSGVNAKKIKSTFELFLVLKKFLRENWAAVF